MLALSWASVVVPALSQTLTTVKYRVSVGANVADTRVTAWLDLALTLSLVLICVFFLITRVDQLPTRGRFALVLILAPWAYQTSRDLYVGISPKLGGLLYPLIALTIWMLRPALSELRVLGYLTGLTAIGSIALGALFPRQGIYSSQAGTTITPVKEILHIGILVGPFPNGNNLGQFLVLGLPWVLLIRSRTVKAVIVASTAFALLWTSARSSLAVMGVGAAALVLLAITPRARRHAVALLMPGIAAAVVIALPLITTSYTAFTNRGYIWRSSLEFWAADPWFGLGSDWYSTSGKYSEGIGSTAFHGHNEFVQLLVLGGLVNLFLVGLMFVMLAWAGAAWVAPGRRFLPSVYLTMLLLSGALEVSFSFVHRSFLMPVTLPVLAFIAFGSRDEPELPPVRAPATEDPFGMPLREDPPLLPDLGPAAGRPQVRTIG